MLYESRISLPRKDLQEKMFYSDQLKNESTPKETKHNPKKYKIKKISLFELCQCKNELVQSLKDKNKKDQPITITNELKSQLKIEIDPIIYHINASLKTDIIISIKLIEYLQRNQQLQESISIIAESFIQKITEKHEMSIIHGFSYILSRVTQLTHIENVNITILFFTEFSRYIPWININHIFTSNQYLKLYNKDLTSTSINEIQCLFGMILEWFSYDLELVEFVSIPIIKNIINQGDLANIDGYLIETFFETTGSIAQEICPNKFKQIFELLSNKLKKHDITQSSSLSRLNDFIQKPKLARPYTLKYEDYTQDSGYDDIIDQYDFDKLSIENGEFIYFFINGIFNTPPITVTKELRNQLINEINPIINPINVNLKTDIIVSIRLIEYLQKNLRLPESIFVIAQSFIQRIIEEREMSIIHGFSYILSRVTQLTHIENANITILFFTEFSRYIPWININHIFTSNQYLKLYNKDLKSTSINEIQCLFGMILEWFSYDLELVEFVSIPIIKNIINQGDLANIDGYLIETFFETTGSIAQEACPNKFNRICELLSNKLKEHDITKSPSLTRLDKLIQNPKLPRPFTLKYENIKIIIPDEDETQDKGYTGINHRNVDDQNANIQNLSDQNEDDQNEDDQNEDDQNEDDQNEDDQIEDNQIEDNQIEDDQIEDNRNEDNQIEDDQNADNQFEDNHIVNEKKDNSEFSDLNREFINFFINGISSTPPITVTKELRNQLINEINPIINPINVNLKTDIIVSIRLIEYLQKNLRLPESIFVIAQSFIQRIIEEREMSIIHGFSYILSRVTQLTHIDNVNITILFFTEFSRYIPWININHIFTSNQYLKLYNKDLKSTNINEIQCLFGMILEWFSYDLELVEFVSIPIIKNIINQGDLANIDGYLIETFFETTGSIAQEICPHKLQQIFELLSNKLKEYNITKSPSLTRLNKLIQNPKLSRPFTLKYEEITITIPDEDENAQ